MTSILFSQDMESFDWIEAVEAKTIYGPKGALLAALPRAWTPPFALLPATLLNHDRTAHSQPVQSLPRVERFIEIAGEHDLIVRSSVIGESIWDHGKYQSVVVAARERGLSDRLEVAIKTVLSSATDKQCGIVIQRYIRPKARGEFANLQRVSKTRDHWELGSIGAGELTSRIRFNTQRDEAAPTNLGLIIRSGQSRERLFGSVAAWLNNELLTGRSQRLSCEWVIDGEQLYLVQLDEEDEDFHGKNPFQMRVAPMHQPAAATGHFLAVATGPALQQWDKLRVLDELGEANAAHQPMLFFVPLSKLENATVAKSRDQLEADFRALIGPDNIVVRTSGRVSEKIPNLPRTECMTPAGAAEWCFEQLLALKDIRRKSELAFVAHRFISAKASAWVRAEPKNASVEIHSLWGLPDGLQTCPYDIWEVHVQTGFATEYSEYKSNMLVARDDGAWEYTRVKNEVARSLSIGRTEALELARRSHRIAERLGKPCHVMWFIGCVDSTGTKFNLPWYWTEAHDADKNIDRANYQVITISTDADLKKFLLRKDARWRQALELKPTDPNLMRDTKFIESVGAAAQSVGVPVILEGSTLAHAYYQLRRLGCTVVARGEKDHSRVRRSATFGKLVRDEIPARIARRQEAEATRTIPNELMKGFLTGKLLEEALEVRNATTPDQKRLELADVLEVLRAMARVEGIPMGDISAAADEKKGKAGGFEKGLVLLQTGILGRDRRGIAGAAQPLTQVLARRNAGNSYDIPFSFFGFMEFDQTRVLTFEELGIQIHVRLLPDRIELSVTREPEQLDLALDHVIAADDPKISDEGERRNAHVKKKLKANKRLKRPSTKRKNAPHARKR